MNIVFVSFIDSTNIGDLLIADVLEEKLMKGHTISKYSFNLIPEDKISKVYSEKKSSQIKSLLKNIYNDVFRQIDIIDRLHLLKIKKSIDNNKYLARFEEDVKNCDLLIVGGGNAIFDLTKHSLSAYKMNKILSIAEKYQKKIFVTSIGIGPFKTEKQIEYTVQTLNKADYITVRDKKSYKYIKSLKDKAFLSIDPVFLLNKQTIDETREEKVISICVIDLILNKDNMQKYKKYIRDFVNLINKLSKENYKIHLYSTEPRDYRAVYDVYNAIENKSYIDVVTIKDSDDLIKLYSQTDLIIGTRMHSMIIGISQFIPIIGLSWQDKVKEMFEMTNLSDDVFEIENLDKEINNIVTLVSEKINNSQLADQLQSIKKDNEIRFEKNEELLKNLCVDLMVEKKEYTHEG